MKPTGLLALVMLILCIAGCESPPSHKSSIELPDPNDNPYEPSTRAHFEYFKSQMWDAAEKDLAKHDPRVARKFRQGVNLTEAKVGMEFNWPDYGLPIRTSHSAVWDGSVSTYVYELGDGYVSITVNDQTNMITSVSKSY